MIKKILLILLLFPIIGFSQVNNEDIYKTISGFVKFENKPISFVAVTENNSNNVTFTNDKGFYKIKIKVGKSLEYNHINFQNVYIIVEDVTEILNVDLRKESEFFELENNNSLKLGGSRIGSTSIKFPTLKIKGDSLNIDAFSLTEAILEKIPFFHAKQNKYKENLIYLKGKELDGPVFWNIDGYEYNIPIPVFIDEVKDVYIESDPSKNVVITVNTNIDYDKVEDIDYSKYFFYKDDFYNNDAISYNKLIKYIPDYLKEYENITDEKEILKIYENQYSLNKDKTNYHFNVINYMNTIKDNKNAKLKILSDFEKIAANNPEDLKSIAYKYQVLGEHEKALTIFKNIAKLRPNYSQSYRDIANCFLDLEDYNNFWLTYNNYFNKNLKLENNDIGEIITSEMIAAYNKEDKNTTTKRIKIEDPNKIIKSDVRLVFEWNTSEAEFIIEFVNPKKYIYTLENSLYNNNYLIDDQKNKGYTSKEVLIEKIKRGDWLINFTYLGNKQYKPTILKVTSYYNWGKKNQTKKIDVFEFTIKDTNTQLLKINRSLLR